MTDKSTLIQKIYAKIPYSNQIENLDITSEESAVRFDWRGDRYRVSINGHVEEVGNGILSSSPSAILMQTLIQGYLP